MSIEHVRHYFSHYHLAHRVLEFPVSSATVEEAAIALGTEEKRIAKTMSFEVAGIPTLVVMAGDARIDNAKFKAQFKVKANMLKGDDVLEKVGHPIGGVCPFAIKEGVAVYLDESLKRFDTVFPACGSRNSAIELNLSELEQYSGSLAWVHISKDWA